MNYELGKLENKKIAMLGLGAENYALIKYLIANWRRIGDEFIEYNITICDARSEKELGERYIKLAKKVRWKLGKNYDKDLEKYDIIFRSPGWPLAPLVKGGLRGVIISSPMKLFFDLCPTKNIIGVTGTKGKGTTATLIYEILKKAGWRVWLGGNIGVAPFEFLDKIKKNDWVVLEMSSFQLQDMEVSPHIAVITNFYKEHLSPADPLNPNYHKSLKEYWDAKVNIIKWQRRGDWAIINSEIKNSPHEMPRSGNFAKAKLFHGVKSKVIYFTKSNLPSKLIGEHNKENVAAAAGVAKIIGVKNDIIKKAIAKFKGLEHRLEFAGQIKSIKFYNDSFATTPESTIIALKSFSAPIILLAGGADKGADFRLLAKEITRRVKAIILLNGEATPRIKKELLKIKYPKEKIKLVFSMKEAMREAKKTARAGDVVLLSPACASFGMFKNYKERGRLFKIEVGKLA